MQFQLWLQSTEPFVSVFSHDRAYQDFYVTSTTSAKARKKNTQRLDHNGYMLIHTVLANYPKSRFYSCFSKRIFIAESDKILISFFAIEDQCERNANFWAGFSTTVLPSSSWKRTQMASIGHLDWSQSSSPFLGSNAQVKRRFERCLSISTNLSKVITSGEVAVK